MQFKNEKHASGNKHNRSPLASYTAEYHFEEHDAYVNY